MGTLCALRNKFLETLAPEYYTLVDEIIIQAALFASWSNIRGNQIFTISAALIPLQGSYNYLVRTLLNKTVFVIGKKGVGEFEAVSDEELKTTFGDNINDRRELKCTASVISILDDAPTWLLESQETPEFVVNNSIAQAALTDAPLSMLDFAQKVKGVFRDKTRQGSENLIVDLGTSENTADTPHLGNKTTLSSFWLFKSGNNPYYEVLDLEKGYVAPKITKLFTRLPAGGLVQTYLLRELNVPVIDGLSGFSNTAAALPSVTFAAGTAPSVIGTSAEPGHSSSSAVQYAWTLVIGSHSWTNQSTLYSTAELFAAAVEAESAFTGLFASRAGATLSMYQPFAVSFSSPSKGLSMTIDTGVSTLAELSGSFSYLKNVSGTGVLTTVIVEQGKISGTLINPGSSPANTKLDEYAILAFNNGILTIGVAATDLKWWMTGKTVDQLFKFTGESYSLWRVTNTGSSTTAWTTAWYWMRRIATNEVKIEQISTFLTANRVAATYTANLTQFDVTIEPSLALPTTYAKTRLMPLLENTSDGYLFVRCSDFSSKLGSITGYLTRSASGMTGYVALKVGNGTGVMDVYSDGAITSIAASLSDFLPITVKDDFGTAKYKSIGTNTTRDAFYCTHGSALPLYLSRNGNTSSPNFRFSQRQDYDSVTVRFYFCSGGAIKQVDSVSPLDRTVYKRIVLDSSTYVWGYTDVEAFKATLVSGSSGGVSYWGHKLEPLPSVSTEYFTTNDDYFIYRGIESESGGLQFMPVFDFSVRPIPTTNNSSVPVGDIPTFDGMTNPAPCFRWLNVSVSSDHTFTNICSFVGDNDGFFVIPVIQEPVYPVYRSDSSPSAQFPYTVIHTYSPDNYPGMDELHDYMVLSCNLSTVSDRNGNNRYVIRAQDMKSDYTYSSQGDHSGGSPTTVKFSEGMIELSLGITTTGGSQTAPEFKVVAHDRTLLQQNYLSNTQYSYWCFNPKYMKDNLVANRGAYPQIIGIAEELSDVVREKTRPALWS